MKPVEIAPSERFGLPLILFLAALTVGVGGMAFWHQHGLRQQAEQQAHANLMTILEGRTAVIANWIKERRSDGQQVTVEPLLRVFLQGPQDPQLRNDVQSWMDAMRRNYDYEALILLGADLRVLTDSPAGIGRRYVDLSSVGAPENWGQGVGITELHRSAADAMLHFTVTAPIPGLAPAAESAAGLMLMVMDPESFIFPTLRQWPVISESSETLLVRREGDEVVFLNDLRYDKQAALRLRFPASQADLPAAQSFVRNKASVFAGRDYRGVPVVAATGPVPGTPWHLVVKTDKDEVLADYTRSLRQLVILVLLLLLVVGLSAFLLWRKRRVRHLHLELVQRRISESAARDVAMRMKLATEATGLGIWEWQLSRGRMLWDAQMYRIYGLEPTGDHVMQYEDWKATVVPEDLPLREAALARARRGYPSQPVEFRIRRADTGELRYLVANETLRISEQDGGDSVIGTTLDITERKQAEEDLRQSMDRIQIANDLAGVGIWEWNLKTDEVKWDERVAEIYGFDAHPEQKPKIWECIQFVVAEDREEQERILQQTVATKKASRREFRIRRASDNSLRIIQAADTVRLNEKGEVEWLVGSNLDITDRRFAEDRIERLSTVVEQTSLSIVITDLEGNIEYTNPYFSTLTGYTAAEIRGQNSRILQSGEMAREDYKELWQEITAGRTWRGLFHNRKKDGELFWEEALICPLRDSRNEVDGYLAVKSDVTARVESEREIKELNEELENRVKRRTLQLELAVQELESFSYSVSHDLRAPLRAIDGWAQVLLDDFGQSLQGDGAEALNRLRAATQRMGTLIDDLLRLSRVNRQGFDVKPVAMETLVREVLGELEAAQPTPMPTVRVFPLPETQGSSSLLRQVWANLIGNAFKFSAKAETPTIEVGSRTQEDGTTVYYVKDNGAGFDMRYVHKLFGAFQRLHSSRDYPGSGIGLALSQRIVRRHGGRIWAEGASGRGAEFCFTIEPNAISVSPEDHPKERHET